MAKTVQAKRYDLTVFKIHWGNLTLKIYDKGARVLRIEVVVHNTKELRCGKVLETLPVLREQVIKPLLAGVIRPRGRPPKTVHPIDQHYIRLREEMHATFETLGLAA